MNQQEQATDKQEEMARYSFDGELYIVYRNGATYTVDAEWSDGPAAEFDHLPREAEVEQVHRDAMEAFADNTDTQRLVERVATEEAARQLVADAVAEEKALARDLDNRRLLTVEEVAAQKGVHPETVRRLVRDGGFERARAVGVGQRKVWLLDADEVEQWSPRTVGRPRKDSE